MTEQRSPVPGPGILDIAPYVGGDAKLDGVERPIRLASNESALGPSAKAIAAYRALASEIHRYPDGGATELREALGEHHGLDPARIVCGSGSDELIGLLQRAYAGPDTEILYSRHGFLMYPIGAQAAGATPVAAPERELTADVDAILARVTPKTRLVFVANPNNPTGTYLSVSEMARLHAGLPGNVVLAIDAAYAEFVNRNDYEPGVKLVDGAENVVMIRTFSKIYALAGLRLGWGYFPSAIADVLNRVRGPFNVGAAALAAGLAALRDTEALKKARAHNDRWQPWLNHRMAALGLAPTPSVGNFVLPRFPDGGKHDADAAFRFLQSRGILTRKMAGYGLPDRIRITVGTGEENEKVAATLAEFMAKLMPEALFDRVAIVGIGLIGSSLARVIRRDLPGAHITACARRAETLEAVRRLGIADATTDDPAAAVAEADLVVLATPLSAYADIARKIASALKPGAIVTDVGSVKENAIRDIAPALPKGVHFVPGHPVAGTEHSGPEAGFAEMFADRWCILTPPEGSDPAAVAKVTALWRLAKMRVVTMPAEHHDRVLAMTSHLPHLIAYTIVGTANALGDDLKSEVIAFSAGGFRDFTRIAASDPVMWRDIFLKNREAVLDVIQRFSEDLSALQRAIRRGEGDALEDWFTRTRAIRRSVIEAKQA